jgi:hypothetical protein
MKFAEVTISQTIHMKPLSAMFVNRFGRIDLQLSEACVNIYVLVKRVVTIAGILCQKFTESPERLVTEHVSSTT